MSLKDDIFKFRENIPVRIREMIKTEKEHLESSGILESCLKTGDRIPEPGFEIC